MNFCNGATAEVNYIRRYPVLNNTPEHTEFCKQLVRDWLGEAGLVAKAEAVTASEDFAFFLERVPGCFINIGSTAAVRPRPGLTWYNGSKGAVVMITKSWAVELAPDRIRANAINPSIADTPLLTTFMGAADTPENRARFTASIPLGRLGRATDVANAAVFFADPASEFITGTCLEVDGGRCI